MMINKIGIYLRPSLDATFKSILKNLAGWLDSRHIDYSYINYESVKGNPTTYIENEEINVKSFDMILSLGGDGTLISLLRKLDSKSPPVFGANLGSLGFTTEFSKHSLFEDLEKCFNKHFEIKKIQLYNAKIKTKKNEIIYSKNFVNDAVFSKKDISRLIFLSLEANNDHIYNIRGDGLIISTPLGSTAYSLAASGPIIFPDVPSLVITPICPHSLTHRPIVIPNNFNLKIEGHKTQNKPIMTLDGQSAVQIEKNQFVEITKAKKGQIKIIANPEKEYFHTLKTKFTLGRK